MDAFTIKGDYIWLDQGSAIKGQESVVPLSRLARITLEAGGEVALPWTDLELAAQRAAGNLTPEAEAVLRDRHGRQPGGIRLHLLGGGTVLVSTEGKAAEGIVPDFRPATTLEGEPTWINTELVDLWHVTDEQDFQPYRLLAQIGGETFVVGEHDTADEALFALRELILP